jgi:hypothetical protein
MSFAGCWHREHNKRCKLQGGETAVHLLSF